MLTNLTPFENLASIGGIMNIINNASLTHLAGLENIDPESITDLSINNNPQLSECDIQSICEYLVSPGGTIEIFDNASGCNSQSEVEDDCNNNCLPEGIEFETQAAIDYFQSNNPGCSEIEGNVTIGKFQTSSDISNLNGLNVLTAIGGYLDIRLNNNLTSLSGLSNLSSVGGMFSIYNNDALTSLTGLDLLTSIGTKLYLSYNDGLIDISGLESLSYVGGDLIIRENSVLTNLTGLENLNMVGGPIEIRVNELLENINGLSGLTSIGDYLWIVGNNALTSLEGLEGITSVPSYLNIGYNPALTNLSGLNNLITIGGYLEIRENQNLMNLYGIHNLTSIGGRMEYRNNESLEDFQALTNLTSIGAEFRVSQNNLLTSLAGLDNIDAVSISDLYLHNNALLSTCEIESVCDYLAAPNGAIYITANASGCYDQEEVEEACFTNVLEISHEDNFTISPNPASGSANLRYMIFEKGYVICDLFEISGVKVKSVVNEIKSPGEYEMEIDLTDLPKGVYFCVLKTKKEIETKKIIKL